MLPQITFEKPYWCMAHDQERGAAFGLDLRHRADSSTIPHPFLGHEPHFISHERCIINHASTNKWIKPQIVFLWLLVVSDGPKKSLYSVWCPRSTKHPYATTQKHSHIVGHRGSPSHAHCCFICNLSPYVGLLGRLSFEMWQGVWLAPGPQEPISRFFRVGIPQRKLPNETVPDPNEKSQGKK